MNYEIVPEDKVKDYILKETALELGMNLELVETIISHQFRDLKLMLGKGDHIKISSIGTFRVSQPRLEAQIRRSKAVIIRIKKQIEDSPDSAYNSSREIRIQNHIEKIEYFKTKLFIDKEIEDDQSGLEGLVPGNME